MEPLVSPAWIQCKQGESSFKTLLPDLYQPSAPSKPTSTGSLKRGFVPPPPPFHLATNVYSLAKSSLLQPSPLQFRPSKSNSSPPPAGPARRLRPVVLIKARSLPPKPNSSHLNVFGLESKRTSSSSKASRNLIAPASSPIRPTRNSARNVKSYAEESSDSEENLEGSEEDSEGMSDNAMTLEDETDDETPLKDQTAVIEIHTTNLISPSLSPPFQPPTFTTDGPSKIGSRLRSQSRLPSTAQAEKRSELFMTRTRISKGTSWTEEEDSILEAAILNDQTSVAETEELARRLEGRSFNAVRIRLRNMRNQASQKNLLTS
ncbi:hypothetical protein T439DRAFT_376753 [Meredithblackwellia eburnea MCA 4105]